jgi:transketolase
MTKNYLDLNRSKNNQYMRDVFIDGIFEEAQKNKDIFFTTPDMGAPSLDQFREKIPKQYIHSGICEQHMISMAAGLTMMNKKVFCYAMAPFITSRCYEQIKCSIAAMQQPVNLVGIGVGLGYADAGPTHYTTEDIATMRVFPDIEIITAADEVFTKKLVTYCLNKDKFRFIRLDRDALPIIYKDSNKIDFELGFSEIYTKKSDCCIISCGYLLHKVSELIDRKNLNYSLIDLFKIKPIKKEFLEHIKKYKTIITIEEQWLDGGFGSAILEKISEADLDIKVKRYGLEKKYLFENGGRNFLLNKFGLNLEKIL